MANSILLVTHCYATQLPHYAAFLRYQLESIAEHAQRTARVAVCFTPSDEATTGVIQEYLSRVDIKGYALQLDELGRRSIGRNRAAMDAGANIVWFTDVDYVFGSGCLKALSEMYWDTGWSMVYPHKIMIHKTHAIGDEYAKKHRPMSIDDFEFQHYNRAIGGVQIVRGDQAREHGYLNCQSKWQQPTTKPFGDFRDDLAYRGECADRGQIHKIELPNLYRLRHSTTTYQ